MNLQLCTWCGHPDHPAGCPITVQLPAPAGNALRRFIGEAKQTVPCPCARRVA